MKTLLALIKEEEVDEVVPESGFEDVQPGLLFPQCCLEM